MKIITIFTEDKSTYTNSGIESLIKSAFFSSDYDLLVTQENRYFANKWKSSDYVEMAAVDISKALINSEYIIIYSDGDDKWSNYIMSSNENAQINKMHFEKLLVHVRKQLAIIICNENDIDPRELEEQVDYFISKVFLLSPCWNIESWSYFNKEEFRKIAVTYKLMDVVQPILDISNSQFEEKKMSKLGLHLKKSSASNEGKDIFNEELLSNNYPIQELYNQNKSFKFFVDNFKLILGSN